MPAYNAQAFIRQAVESVLAQQGDIPRELLIIDDGSTDQTKEVIQELIEQNADSDCELIFFENKKIRVWQNQEISGFVGPEESTLHF